MPDDFLKHWMLLSWSVYQLLQERISPESVGTARVALDKFVVYTTHLYGKEHVSFNVHQLVQLCDTVRSWGPLWAHSSFPFESMNHVILQLKHGTQHTAIQISDFEIHIIARKALHGECSDVLLLNSSLQHRGGYMPKGSRTVGRLRIYGKCNTISIDERLAIQRSFGVQLEVGMLADHYDRFSTSNFTLCSSE